MSERQHASDRSAAFTGLILGAVLLLILLYGTVRLTRAHHASEASAGKASAATR